MQTSAPRPLVPGVPLVAGARLPLAFIGCGLGALAWAAGVLATSPRLLLLPHAHPAVVAFAHLWLPGFLLSVSMGAVYQLMPVALGKPLRLPLGAAWTHLGLHLAGVPLLVGGFSLGRFDVVALGGVPVAAGIGVFAVGTWRTFLASSRRDAVAWSFPLAVTWLAAAVGFGLVIAVNRHVNVLPWSVLDLLRSHAHVGVGGFFLTLLQGATFQLVPMFTLAEVQGERWVGAGVVLSQVGLLMLAPGLALGLRVVGLTGALLLVGGIACSGAALGATLWTKRRRGLDPGLKGFALGAALFGVVALGGFGLALIPPDTAVAGRTDMAYGFTIVAGALSLMVMGMLGKIVPFLVWMITYGPRAGRQPVPLAGALASRWLELAWLWLHGIAVGAVGAGLVADAPLLVAGGSVLLAAALGLFLVNLLRVLSHLVRPRAAIAAPLRPAASSS